MQTFTGLALGPRTLGLASRSAGYEVILDGLAATFREPCPLGTPYVPTVLYCLQWGLWVIRIQVILTKTFVVR